MVRALRNKQGKVEELEYTLVEMAELLGVRPKQAGEYREVSGADLLEQWQATIKPSGVDADGKPLYRVRRKDDVELWRKRAAVLRTGLSETSVANIEKAGHLNAYAALAVDCPEGIDAHVWRSYAIVVFMQAKHGRMIDAEELAERGSLVELDPATGEKRLGISLARKHLRLLQGMRLLKAVKPGENVPLGNGKSYQSEGEWLHQGLPHAWQGR